MSRVDFVDLLLVRAPMGEKDDNANARAPDVVSPSCGDPGTAAHCMAAVSSVCCCGVSRVGLCLACVAASLVTLRVAAISLVTFRVAAISLTCCCFPSRASFCLAPVVVSLACLCCPIHVAFLVAPVVAFPPTCFRCLNSVVSRVASVAVPSLACCVASRVSPTFAFPLV